MATPVVNVVVPHPLRVMLPRPLRVNVGSTKVITSVVVCTSGTLSANVNEMAVGADVAGTAIVSTLCWNAGLGTTTSVDGLMRGKKT